MNKIMILMLMMWFAVIGGCASDETYMETDESSKEMANEPTAVDMESSKAEVSQVVVEPATEAPAELTEAATKPDTESDTEVVASSDNNADNNKISVCKFGNQIRVITVVYNDEVSENICQVDYEKSAGVQTLWTAKMDESYCLDRAQEFVMKQEGWGWICSSLE